MLQWKASRAGSAVTASFVATLAAALVVSPAEAQTSGADGEEWEVPRTEHGHPDLQGNWSNATITPLQRPRGQGPVLTPDEVAALEMEEGDYLAQSLDPADPNRPPPPVGGDGSTGAAGGTGGYDSFYIDRGDRVAYVDGEPRSSLITFPEDGRVPSITEDAQEARQQNFARRAGMGQYDHPELRPLAERCIVSFGSNAGPPMLPNYFYNNNYTIVQTADQVMIMTEMINDVRVVQLEDGPPLDDDVRPWFGDSRGWWEDDTLVVETTNIHPEQRFQGNNSDNLRVIERFTRVDEETILYEFEIDDPTVYTERWGGQVPMYAIDDLVFEYACHEGNYALENVLRGARFEERQEAEAQER